MPYILLLKRDIITDIIIRKRKNERQFGIAFALLIYLLIQIRRINFKKSEASNFFLANFNIENSDTQLKDLIYVRKLL